MVLITWAQLFSPLAAKSGSIVYSLLEITPFSYNLTLKQGKPGKVRPTNPADRQINGTEAAQKRYPRGRSAAGDRDLSVNNRENQIPRRMPTRILPGCGTGLI